MNEIIWTSKNFEQVWDDLKVGDFIMKYHGDRATSRGQKILGRCGEGLLLSYCENCSDTWEELCEMERKHNFENSVRYKEEYEQKYPLIIFKSNFLTPNHMSKIGSILKKLARKEPEKSFIEAGFMDEAENITEDGKEALLYLLWREKKEDLKKLADEINNETN